MKTPVKHWEEILKILENNVSKKFSLLDIRYDSSECKYCCTYGYYCTYRCPLVKYEFQCGCYDSPYSNFTNKENGFVDEDMINAAWHMYSVLYFIQESEK